MISDADRNAIIALAERFNVSRVLLFGSSLDPARPADDIDLGVEGIRPEDFFKFYGELLFALSKPLDLIDLSVPTKFARIVKQEGVPLHG